MKKILFFVLLLNIFFPTSLMAEIIVEDPIENRGDNNNGRPRDLQPEVSTSVSGDVLLVDVRNYVGNAQVYVIASDSSFQTCSTYFIYGHSNFTMDFSDLNDGSYTLRVVLDNGISFSGNLVKN